MSSSSISQTRGAETVGRAAVVTHGKPDQIGDAVERLARCAEHAGVELVGEDPSAADVVVVLGGDGTMLRALRASLGSRTPVFGVNFGRVGFLTSADGSELETAVARVFRGEFKVISLCTLEVELPSGSAEGINDVVVTSSKPGRMVELDWVVSGEDLGRQPCDGIICATPTGSTAYNLSNGGPVVMWGLEAIAITFVAPHSLHARPLVVPRGVDVRITNATPDVAATVTADGHPQGELGPGDAVAVRLGGDPALLALLPEVTFFSRYHQAFP